MDGVKAALGNRGMTVQAARKSGEPWYICNPKHPLCGSLPVPYVPVRVTRGALMAHLYTFAEPRSTAVVLFLSQSLSG